MEEIRILTEGNRYNEEFKADIIRLVREGWLYSATVKDIFTKEFVGWATADNMKTEL